MRMLDRYVEAASSALGEVAAVAPLTTVVGTAVVAALCALVAELLEQQGHTLPVLASQNLDGPSVADDNVALMARYADRAGEGAP
jgi:uncharacterized phosphosugar-binding protein